MPPRQTISMLLFYCASEEEVKSAGSIGLRSSNGALRVFDRLEEARRSCGEAILVIDSFSLPAPDAAEKGMIPPAALRNVDPYLKPEPVTAGGGYVTRRKTDVLELLMIFRRGVWDLPKGKLDRGESVRECALREVREELGIRLLKIGGYLGATVHGYPEKGRYLVKTTHWFEMSTPAEEFEPQASEDIEAAEWVSWIEARKRIGFETLRRHMDRVERLLVEGG